MTKLRIEPKVSIGGKAEVRLNERIVHINSKAVIESGDLKYGLSAGSKLTMSTVYLSKKQVAFT